MPPSDNTNGTGSDPSPSLPLDDVAEGLDAKLSEMSPEDAARLRKIMAAVGMKKMAVRSESSMSTLAGGSDNIHSSSKSLSTETRSYNADLEKRYREAVQQLEVAEVKALDDKAEIDVQTRLYKNAQRELNAVEAELATSEAEVKKLKKDAEENRNTRSYNHIQLCSMREKLARLEAENAELTARSESMTSVVQMANKWKETAQKEAQTREAITLELSNSQAAHVQEVLGLRAENNTLGGALEVANTVIKSKDVEIERLQAELGIAKRLADERQHQLCEADTEKRRLVATNLQLTQEMEESAAVFGEASLVFSTEVDRIMEMLLVTKNAEMRKAALRKAALPPTAQIPMPMPSPISTPPLS